MSDADLARLAEGHGIAARWYDIGGTEHYVTVETQRALLAAMGVPAGTDAEVAESLRLLHAEQSERPLPREVFAETGNAVLIPISRPAEWRLECEDGNVLAGRADEAISLTPPLGIHRLVVDGDTCLVIAAPVRAPGVADLTGRPGIWGMTVPLYGLRSARNLGVGDYADLAAAAESFGALGADFVGINPIHARGAASGDISPYSPSSRVAYDTWLIAVDRIPGAGHSEALGAVLARHANALRAARARDLADYGLRAAIAEPLLRAMYDERRAPTELPVPSATEALRRFALFEALSLDHGLDWHRWPQPLQDPLSRETAAFAEGHADEIAYRLWLQSVAARQIADAQQKARDAGMALGLYLDIAVGVRPDGADVWAEQGAFARGVSLGAPPDAFNPDGQDWTLAPFSPRYFRERGYRPFVEMLRAAMAHAGAIRIDHALGFQRAFWVPGNAAPGGYVDYPFEALLAITRIEAARANCLVVGEDLGSVPPGFRDRLSGSGLYGCSVMQFERDWERFTPASHYRAETIASFGTHDTPTLVGWWTGRDIEVSVTLRHLSPQDLADASAARSRERHALVDMLVSDGFPCAAFEAPDDSAVAAAHCNGAVHAALSASPAAIVAVQLGDALGAIDQHNLPGTTDTYPNWRRKVDVDVETMHDDPRLAGVAAIMNIERGHASPAPEPEGDR